MSCKERVMSNNAKDMCTVGQSLVELNIVSYDNLQMSIAAEKIVYANSRCCCKKTPSTAGRNQDYFYLHFIQTCFQINCHAIYTLDTLCNPLRTAYACALAINMRVSHSIRLLEMRTLPTEKQFC